VIFSDENQKGSDLPTAVKGKFNRLLIWKLMSLMDSRAAAPGIHELTGSWP
jgi:hypothetical protein